MAEVDENGLKLCPFCGDSNITVMEDIGAYVQCFMCEAGTRLYSDKEEAIAAWNRRA